MEKNVYIGKDILPPLNKIRRSFSDKKIINIEEEFRKQIVKIGIKINKNARIAIAVGSRGISNIDIIVKITVDYVKRMGGCPFIVPAMGSHGGATAKGQKEILEGYGITETFIDAKIESSMEVIELDSHDFCHKIFMDKKAYNADGIIIINRIKSHTDFDGKTESGLLKMCVIGLGKDHMAREIHRYGVYGLRELIPKAALKVLKECNILMGIGIMENCYGQTSIIRAIEPKNILREEKEMLKKYKKNTQTLPFKSIDVLIIDEMGKDICGIGLDPEVVGRKYIKKQKEPKYPKIRNIIVSDLTEKTQGNSIGMGLADFITKKFYNKINFKSTYENVVTSTFMERGKMPIVAETTKEAVEFAFKTLNPHMNNEPTVVRIKNTSKLDEMYVSDSLMKKLEKVENIELLSHMDIIFDENGEPLKF